MLNMPSHGLYHRQIPELRSQDGAEGEERLAMYTAPFNIMR